MSHTGRYYVDASGIRLPDRRVAQVERRGQQGEAMRHEQRRFFRRKADRELYEKDHKLMIQEALAEFQERREERPL